MKGDRIWTLYARVYDVINKNIPYLEMLDELFGQLKLGELSEASLILDAGCGTGNMETRILKANIKTSIIGVDASPEMLDRARAKFRNDQQIQFQKTDLNQRLSFGSETFDRVVAINSLYALKDPEFTLREMYRVLKPGGILVFANPHKDSTFFGIMQGQRRALGTLRFLLSFLRNLPSLLVVMFVNIFYLKNDENYWDEATTRSILQSLGFHDISLQTTYADQSILASAVR